MTTTTISSSSSRASRRLVFHVVLLCRWVVRDFGAVGVAAVVLRGRSRSLRGRMLGAGHRLPVVALFGCGCRRVRRLLLWWAAGVVCGGVGRVTWHAGDLEGAHVVVDVGDMAVWSRRVCVVVVRQAVVMVYGRPGLLVVVGVACGRHGGRARRCS